MTVFWPALGDNAVLAAGVGLATIWGLTWVNVAGVHTDPELETMVEIGLPAHVRAERSMHLDGGTRRTIRIVLMGHRRPEQREDSVAEDLVDPAAEPFDLVDEQLERTVDQPLQALGIEVLGQSGVPHQIGEDDSDDASFFTGLRFDAVPAERTEPRPVDQRLRTRHARHQPVIVRHGTLGSVERTLRFRS